MTESTSSANLPPEIRNLLARLRRRIRVYVWLEGISLAIGWLGVTFWLGLALDYLPVLAGVGEMPRPARIVLLTVIASMLAWILYRWLLRRVFARLADRSMAVLLERRFQEFRDGLITSVELTSRPIPETEAGREMLAETERQALDRIQSVRLSDVFNFRPLTLSIAMAVLFAVTVGGFYVVSAPAFEIGFRRIYLLQDPKWPRRARIEVVGVERRSAVGANSTPEVVPFRNRILKAAKGANLSLLVRADASQAVVPDTCSVIYKTHEGERGRVNMTRVGRIRDGYQLYKFDGKPFDGVLSAIDFDVVGADHRVSGNTIQVVDSPTIVQVDVACEFPPYLVDERLSLWLPRTVSYTAGLQLPRGTKLMLHCRANKALLKVQLTNPDTGELLPVPLSERNTDHTEFDFPVEALGEHLTLDVTLVDTDDVSSDRNYRIHIAGTEDSPPTIEMRLAGIGAAVTPDVILPVRGKITDDYGLARSWIEIVVNDSAPREFEFQPKSTGEAETSVDFRSERGKSDGVTLQPKDKLHATIRATDKRDLGTGPNLAAGDHYELDVVTADQLLAILEGRELNLQRRFKQIIEEMNASQDMLFRIKTDGPGQSRAEPGEAANRPNTDEKAALATDAAPATDAARGADATRGADGEQTEPASKRVWSLRLLRARQCLMQSQKSAQEVLGIAAAFGDIREELINNRVDSEDRKNRLQQRIAEPLERIGKELFPELDRRLENLAQVLVAVEQRKAFQNEDPATVAAAQQTIDQAGEILREMDAVLSQMIELESFNELLDIVRTLIDEQERLLNDVKKEHSKSILDLLK